MIWFKSLEFNLTDEHTKESASQFGAASAKAIKLKVLNNSFETKRLRLKRIRSVSPIWSDIMAVILKDPSQETEDSRDALEFAAELCLIGTQLLWLALLVLSLEIICTGLLTDRVGESEHLNLWTEFLKLCFCSRKFVETYLSKALPTRSFTAKLLIYWTRFIAHLTTDSIDPQQVLKSPMTRNSFKLKPLICCSSLPITNTSLLVLLVLPLTVGYLKL